MAKHSNLDRYKEQEAQFRKDPKKSSATSSHSQFRKNSMGLVDTDDKRHYVGVYVQDQEALARYEGQGYVVETLREGGPKYSGYSTSKPGEPVIFRGNILMSIDKIEREQRLAEQQAVCDAVRNKLRNKQDIDQQVGGNHGIGGVIVSEHDVRIPAPAD